MATSDQDDTGLALQIGNFFATPVAATLLPDADARNADLRARILAERDREDSRAASNLGGWHSARPPSEWAGPGIDDIVQAAKHVASRMTLDRAGAPAQNEWAVRAWANVNGRGHANASHYHPGAYWSGTYYVDDGGRLADPAVGGEFEILDPRGPGVAMYSPGLVIADGSGNTGGSTVQFTPRPGLLVLFPSWLQHQVRPYLGDSLRISIAFNLSVLER